MRDTLWFLSVSAVGGHNIAAQPIQLHYTISQLVVKDIKKSQKRLAERQGFEPWEPEGSTVFETAPFNRSGTSPGENISQFLLDGNDIINDENSAQIMARPLSHLYPDRLLKNPSLL